ncbi:DUF4296 domain-containing protein [Terrimonas sp. NA20]|uniref:DUF4296 domain-containing protein n=1 Tax=Terrimonas ginsenosidimutans TaxID=2908004 RepID=A0ABS9KPD8_9BACT|nr:DUF4296 domain-containing protein [Terrimonas ginsenosidimutans]MCG2614195.1 DUF4296 domain-containing protein [Terrimonas ginsenosidimutans]
MKSTWFIFLLLIGIVFSCTDKNKLPEGVLDQPKMQAVMWDMIRAADFLNNYVFYKDASTDKAAESLKWNEKVFKIHKITREQFVKSYAYYQQHPQKMKAMMDSIGKIKAEPEAQKPATMDSLKKDSSVKVADTVKKAVVDTVKLNRRLDRMRKAAFKKSSVQ